MIQNNRLPQGVNVWKNTRPDQPVRVAVLDTGIAPSENFGGRLVAFKDFVNGRDQPYDDHGQGTHVAGIICQGSRDWGLA